MAVVVYKPLLVSNLSQDVCLYEILGVPKNASDKEIKDTYKWIAITFHPDKNPNNVLALEYFKEVSRANAILTDPVKKTIYDTYGAYGLEIGGKYGYHNVDSYFLVTSTWYSLKNKFTSIFTLRNVGISIFGLFGLFIWKPKTLDNTNVIDI